MNNYEKQREDWRQQFLTMDQEDICRRLPEVCKSDTHLTLWHYGRQFAVDRKSGVISALSDSKPVDVMPQLNIYTLFWDGDDEFPAQANILFDKSATDFIHIESIVTIATELLYQLADAAELPIQGTPASPNL